MTISMYQASVPRFANILGNLSNIMDKTQAHRRPENCGRQLDRLPPVPRHVAPDHPGTDCL
jgi:hypothetical protein